MSRRSLPDAFTKVQHEPVLAAVMEDGADTHRESPSLSGAIFTGDESLFLMASPERYSEHPLGVAVA